MGGGNGRSYAAAFVIGRHCRFERGAGPSLFFFQLPVVAALESERSVARKDFLAAGRLSLLGTVGGWVLFALGAREEESEIVREILERATVYLHCIYPSYFPNSSLTSISSISCPANANVELCPLF